MGVIQTSGMESLRRQPVSKVHSDSKFNCVKFCLSNLRQFEESLTGKGWMRRDEKHQRCDPGYAFLTRILSELLSGKPMMGSKRWSWLRSGESEL